MDFYILLITKHQQRSEGVETVNDSLSSLTVDKTVDQNETSDAAVNGNLDHSVSKSNHPSPKPNQSSINPDQSSAKLDQSSVKAVVKTDQASQLITTTSDTPVARPGHPSVTIATKSHDQDVVMTSTNTVIGTPVDQFSPHVYGKK